MDKASLLELLFAGLVLGVMAVIVMLYMLGRSVRKHVEDALKNATHEEQTEIRKKVVKAVFPPRFDRT